MLLLYAIGRGGRRDSAGADYKSLLFKQAGQLVAAPHPLPSLVAALKRMAASAT